MRKALRDESDASAKCIVVKKVVNLAPFGAVLQSPVSAQLQEPRFAIPLSKAFGGHVSKSSIFRGQLLKPVSRVVPCRTRSLVLPTPIAVGCRKCEDADVQKLARAFADSFRL